MRKKYSLILDNEFIEYCNLNNIENIEQYAKDVFQKGFTITKYGDKPKSYPLTEGKIKTNIKEIKNNISTEAPPPPIPRPLKDSNTPKKKENDIYGE